MVRCHVKSRATPHTRQLGENARCRQKCSFHREGIFLWFSVEFKTCLGDPEGHPNLNSDEMGKGEARRHYSLSLLARTRRELLLPRTASTERRANHDTPRKVSSWLSLEFKIIWAARRASHLSSARRVKGEAQRPYYFRAISKGLA